ncbi:MAG: Eco57I restriction-modification methylase domain-containing protein [Gammaproteobacteria bacterium]
MLKELEHKGALFNGHFLKEGIRECAGLKMPTDDEVNAFRADAFAKLELLNDGGGLAVRHLNESDTIGDFIAPILDLLGWHNLRHREPNIGSGSRPDMLLFADQKGKQAGYKKAEAGKHAEACKHAAVILEAKKWHLPLDRRENQNTKSSRSAPSSQMLRYLRDIGEGAEWGILTNGVLWRLYYRRANSKSEHFLELDLDLLLRLNEKHWIRVFMLMFGHDSFAGTFHKNALAESRNWEEKITGELSQKIFDEVFPQLARALADGEKTPGFARLRRIGKDTMTLLFRLLFVLYAEDRGLLPIKEKRFWRYSLADIRRLLDEDDLSDIPDNVYCMFAKFRNLCAAINTGNMQMLTPPYNGGLFSPKRAPLLEEKSISDYEFAKAVKTLAYRNDKRINYRDFSVQHLGAMYERFLELELTVSGGGSGQVVVKPNRYARKSGGSYYTPDGLVQLVIDGAVGVLLREYRAEFDAAVKQKMPMAKLKKLDPAMRGLQIKVCDPAMGSGHFLVSLVDYLADWSLAEIAATENIIDGYHSPLSEEIESVRERIKEEAKKGGWQTEEHHLDDRQIIRRLVLKRAVYGADKNLMAVELAKLSLWLHTFTVGAPLTFLDHHLRHGDSLFGEFAADAMTALGKLGKPLIAKRLLAQAQSAAENMQAIESVTDSNITEVHSSMDAFDAMQKKSAPFNNVLTLLHCRHWFAAEDDKAHIKKINDDNALAAIEAVLQDQNPTGGGAKYNIRARRLRLRESFLHWETAFPGVWSNWANGKKRTGGFDAVIGNPPWDVVKMQAVEWFNVHMPEILKDKKPDEREAHIDKLRQEGNPIIAEYDAAAKRMENMRTVARESGVYPFLSGGDINLYSLFVERSLSLIKPDGMAGLLTPSGIYADKPALKFFRWITSTKRVSKLIDFVNGAKNNSRKGAKKESPKYFPDVDSRFKFCAFVFGGAKRQFSETECAFYVNKPSDIADRRIVFSSGDIGIVNPNTGAMPVFRVRQNADITVGIHRRIPILQKDGEEPLYKIKYVRMFDATGDSDKFIKSAHLENDGFYRIKPNYYKRGDDLFLPLYVGRMIGIYSHRASSVRFNPDNPKNQYISAPSSLEQLCSSDFYAEPIHWVNNKHMSLDKRLTWFIGFRNITNATNQRTMIASLLPRAACTHSLPLLLPPLSQQPPKATAAELKEWREQCSRIIAEYKNTAPLLAANLSSFALDFVARQKMHGSNLTWHIVQQLPIIPPEAYKQKAGDETIGDFVRKRVLRLTYTANDMTPFARDMGHKGKPFIWNEEERAHLRAQLDALYFWLYGIDKNDATYMMDSFSIIRKDDEKQHGDYFTRDLILRYLNAYRAGDWDAEVAAPDYSRSG